MNKSGRKTKTSILLLVMALLSVLGSTFAINRLTAAELTSKLGYVFFIEPFYSMFNDPGAAGAASSMIAFCAWLMIACLIVRIQHSRQGLGLAVLVVFPALAICALHAIPATASTTPTIEPAAVVAVLGALLYSAACGRRWSRLFLLMATLGTCFVYGMHTGLGLVGGLTAACTMAVVVFVWSGLSVPVYNLTFSGHGRKFQYR